MVSQQNQLCMYEKGKILLSTHRNTKWCLNKTNPVCMKKARYYFLHTAILNGVSTKSTLYVWKNQDTTFYTPQYQMVSHQNQPCICEKGKILLSTHRNTKWSLNKTNSVWMKKARYYFLPTAIPNCVSTKPTLYEWKRQVCKFRCFGHVLLHAGAPQLVTFVPHLFGLWPVILLTFLGTVDDGVTRRAEICIIGAVRKITRDTYHVFMLNFKLGNLHVHIIQFSSE